MPAAGKTRWAVRSGARMVSTDAIRAGADGGAVMALAAGVVGDLLAEGHDVVVDACSFDPRRRFGWMRLARAHDTRAVAVLVHAAPSVAKRRNTRRGEFAVPPVVMTGYLRRWPVVAAAVRREPWDEVLEVH